MGKGHSHDHGHDHAHDHRHEPLGAHGEAVDWKVHGVKVIPGDQLDTNTAQTPGMNRAAAINLARVGAQKIWAGTVHIYPTMAEANKYAAGVWRRARVTVGQRKVLTAFHAWSRGAQRFSDVVKALPGLWSERQKASESDDPTLGA